VKKISAIFVREFMILKIKFIIYVLSKVEIK